MPQTSLKKPSRWITVACMVGAIIVLGLYGEGGAFGSGNFLSGALLGAAIGEVIRLRRRTASLEQRLEKAESQAAHSATAITAIQANVAAQSPETSKPGVAAEKTATRAAVAADSASVVESATTAQSVTAPIAGLAANRVAPSAATPPRAAVPLPARPAPSDFDVLAGKALAWLKGGNTIARVGVLILFFGGSFLAKYASDHGHFPIEWRMAGLGLGALALLGLGFWLRGRRPGFGQTLQGGGIAGFYLTVFAATRLFHLLPFGMALGLMVVVALCAAVLAVMQNALALAVLGTGGGFLAPLLVSTGAGNIEALFTYYAILNLGVVAIAWFRAWKVLNLLGFLFTFGITGIFRMATYRPEQLLVADGFLLLFFLMYVGVAILFSLRQPTNLKHYVSGSLVFGLPLATFSLHASYVRTHEFAMAWSALGFGVFYVALAWTLLRSRRENLRLLAEAFAALGVIFGSLAMPLAFDGQTTAALWAVEGAGLIWLGVRQERRLVRAFGALLQLLGGLSFWTNLDHLAGSMPVLNAGYIGCVLVGGAGVLSGEWLRRARATLAAYEALAETAAVLWGLAWFVGGTVTEIARALPDEMMGAELIFAASMIAALGMAGERLIWPLPRAIAATLILVSIVVGLTEASAAAHPFAQAAWLGWPLVFVTAYGLMYRLDRSPEPAIAAAKIPLHLTLLCSLCLIVAWEFSYQIGCGIQGVWPLLPAGLVPAAALWLLGRTRLLPAWPIRTHEIVYRIWGGGGLAVAAALWVLVVNLTSDGDPVRLVYLPLLNPLDVGVLLVAVAGLRWWWSLASVQRAPLTPEIPAMAAALLFFWSNTALIRALHYLAGAALEFEAAVQSNLVEAALSIYWGLLGFVAMTLASRRDWRPIWMIGAGLMGVVVLKLFIVDTASRGTLSRIVAFLIVGGLLLLTGYLSPLPPKRATVSGHGADPENVPQ